MKYLVAICWVVTLPAAIVVLSYKIAFAYIEFVVREANND